MVARRGWQANHRQPPLPLAGRPESKRADYIPDVTLTMRFPSRRVASVCPSVCASPAPGISAQLVAGKEQRSVLRAVMYGGTTLGATVRGP